MARINSDTLNLSEQVVRTNKVQKTHKGGRTMSWSTLVVVGDHAGHVGAGIGKARAIPDAIRKGTEDAKKNLIRIPIVNGTIPHEVLAGHGASQVLIKPAAPGTGVVAGGAVRILLEYAGVTDVLAKSLGSNNPVNNAWATIHALSQLKTADEYAALRGRSVTELRRGAAVAGEVLSALVEAKPAPAPEEIQPVPAPVEIEAEPAGAVAEPVAESSEETTDGAA